MVKLAFLLKVVVIWASALASVIVYESCCGVPDFPYREITRMDLFTKKAQLGALDTLKLQLIPVDYKYYASSARLIQSAYAWICESDGYRGHKFKYTQIEIFSDKDFDSTHPAGSLLNDLFLVKPPNENLFKPVQGNIPSDSLIMDLVQGGDLITEKRPSTYLAHNLTISIRNENDTKVSSSISINWK